ncbi:MAG: hypothetical protein HN793_00335 [Rhodospirillaceae bacterium]|nr:hypothetical protein [Rhodospirillaceae bacterium]MBT5241901.1 hypothetical protein [Rhodospirillaceae bacterium]MBT5567050.1 hypothetical protein [Rhodospirillaceae bacterium]MBT6089557.1 hypothetical protein [Rhodospirillaceae bacterium]MBT7449243.1 hypothetical protein [Rhodospirillaceae bacterium]
MKRFLEWANAGDAIHVDVDALWRKAVDDGRDVSIRVKRSLSSDILSDMGELAILSAMARGKGKKG